MTFLSTGEILKIFPATILMATLMIETADAQATSRMADATVSLVRGVPCFGVSPEEERDNGVPLLKAVDISDVQQGKSIWGFFLPQKNDRLKIPVPSCVLYGHIPPGSIGAEAPVLQRGHMYDVYLNGRTADPGDSTQGYQARFCLMDDPGGNRRIVQFPPGSPEWRQGICVLPAR